MDRRFRVAISVMVLALLLIPRLAAAQSGPVATAPLPPPLAVAPLPAPAKPTLLPERKPPAQRSATTGGQLAEARAHALMKKPRPALSKRRETAHDMHRPMPSREATEETGWRRGYAAEGPRRPQIASVWPGAAPPPWGYYDGPPFAYGPYGPYGPGYRYPRRWGRGGPWY